MGTQLFCSALAVSACTKLVVGKGVVSMMRGTGLGDGGTGAWDCCWRGDGEAAADEGEEEEVEEDGELGAPRAMGRSCFTAATSIRAFAVSLSRARAGGRWFHGEGRAGEKRGVKWGGEREWE